MKFLLIVLVLLLIFVGNFSDFISAQISNPNTLKVSFENNVLSSYEVPLVSGKTFILTQNYSWIHDETSRYNLVSYTLDGETVKISRNARGDFTLNINSDSSHTVVFSAVSQYALSVEGTNDFSYFPSSPTNDNWFDVGTEVSVNVQKTTEVEPNKVRQEITGWSLDKSEFWNIEDDESPSFTTPPILMNEYHQIDFFNTYQYKLNVVSDSGITSGSGWYEQGVTVPIDIDIGGNGIILNSLSKWEGAEIEYDGNLAQVFIDGPVTVSAKVEKNYSLLVGVIVILVLIVGVIAGKKFKRDIHVIIEKPVEKSDNVSQKKHSDKYNEELLEFLSDKIKSKIDELYNVKIISHSTYSKIKETL